MNRKKQIENTQLLYVAFENPPSEHDNGAPHEVTVVIARDNERDSAISANRGPFGRISIEAENMFAWQDHVDGGPERFLLAVRKDGGWELCDGVDDWLYEKVSFIGFHPDLPV